jgi:hypothetical protein
VINLVVMTSRTIIYVSLTFELALLTDEMGMLSELPSAGNMLYSACLAYCTSTQRLSDSASKLLATQGTKESTLVVPGATKSSELLNGWFPTPFAEASIGSKICHDRAVKIRV